FQAEDGIRDDLVTGVQTCALPIYLVLIPAIKFFGAGLAAPLAPETARLIRNMDVSAIQKAYILYVGAGAVAAGGIISLLRSLPRSEERRVGKECGCESWPCQVIDK